MKSIQIFDKPMCCATGVCGPQVDPVLPRFAADLDWLRSRGPSVERFNLAQQPDAFVRNPMVQELLATRGVDCLPLIFVDGTLKEQSQYPSRERFAAWAGLEPVTPSFPTLFVVSANDDCNQPDCC